MPNAGMERFFIGELAEQTGLTRDTIRYYESAGVLPEAERSESGYRVYGSDDIERIAFVGQAQTLGLTLEEIAEILEIVGDGREPCVHVRRRLSLRLDQTRDRIARLRELERRLVDTLARSEGTSAEPGCRCHIIESAGPMEPSMRRPPRREM